MMTSSPQENGTHQRNRRSADELYAAYKDQLQHENENMNQRIMWSVFSQATLFTAYMTALTAPMQAKDPYFGLMQDFAVWIIPSVGLLLSLFIFPSIISALIYMAYLRQRFEKGVRAEEINDLPPIDGNPRLRHWSNLTPMVLPCILVVAWAVILPYQAMIWLRPVPPL